MGGAANPISVNPLDPLRLVDDPLDDISDKVDDTVDEIINPAPVTIETTYPVEGGTVYTGPESDPDPDPRGGGGGPSISDPGPPPSVSQPISTTDTTSREARPSSGGFSLGKLILQEAAPEVTLQKKHKNRKGEYTVARASGLNLV